MLYYNSNILRYCYSKTAVFDLFLTVSNFAKKLIINHRKTFAANLIYSPELPKYHAQNLLLNFGWRGSVVLLWVCVKCKKTQLLVSFLGLDMEGGGLLLVRGR